MALPELNKHGDLPIAVHPATLAEVVARFGAGTPQRQAVTARLLRIHELAISTGALQRFVIFGSYITEKPEPNDVDVLLIMQEDFRLGDCPDAALALFDHERASGELGASIFWARPTMFFLEPTEQFIAEWQIKRDRGRRGIVEVIP